jgi:hypothetical protein
MKKIALACALLALVVSPFFITAQTPASLRTRFQQLTRAAQWRQVAALPLQFNTHHPQGMVKIGDVFYLSSVEVTQPTKRFAQPQNGYDRDTGAGVGHLFKFDSQGKLLADHTLGEGTLYHPGGIDFDGRHLWVSVAEYRPNSRSIIYRVNPATMRATEIFRFNDHLGGIIHKNDEHITDGRTLHAISWGSRWFYRWPLDAQGRIGQATKSRNPSFYIDYQDCKYLGRNTMLCGGLSNYLTSKARFSLGGLELVDLRTNRAIHQLPVELWTETGLPMTQNPFWIEATAGGLRVYFLPEDRNSTLYVYEVTP